MALDDRILIARKIPGFMTDQELGWLYDNAKGKAVEIGTYEGRSASMMVKVDHLTCVDLWASDNPTYRDLEMRYQEFLKRKPSFPFSCSITRKSSVEAAKDFEDKSLDFVFIDGSHDFTSVLMDIRAWKPKVKEGGLMSGHDFNDPVLPDVRRAVKTEFKQIALCGTIWSTPITHRHIKLL